MAAKKTGKRASKSRSRRHLRVFAVSLFVVLFLGAAAMATYAVLVGHADKEEKEPEVTDHIVIDFTTTDGQPETARESEGTSAASEQEAAMTKEEALLAENERLYQEAIERGENVRLVDCADSARVTFAFAGDILLDDKYAMMYAYTSRGSNIDDTFTGGLLERMRGADVFMLNNEFAFSERGEPTEGKQFTFRAKPSNVSLYEQMGVDVVSLANNHAYDYGEEALLDTFVTLEEAGIPYVGAGRNIEEAKKPVYFVANGMKIAVVSATQIERNGSPDTKEATSSSAGVLRCMDPAALLSVIAEAKENSDFVILYIHWGTEGEAQTDWLQDQQAPIYAEAGVNLIIGDHPHCLQKIDAVSGVPVIYSLGNFWFNSKTQDTCLVEVGINQDGIEYFRFLPCRQEDRRTRLLDGAEKEEVLDSMRELSPNVTIDADGYISFG